MTSPSVAAHGRRWELRGGRGNVGDVCVWGGMEKKVNSFILKRMFLSHGKCSGDLSAGFVYLN